MKRTTLAIAWICVCANVVNAQTDPLPSWNDGPARQTIVDFVKTTTTRESPNFLPREERIAVFDQVGTFSQKLYDEAQSKGWTVISMKRDWKRIFAFEE